MRVVRLLEEVNFGRGYDRLSLNFAWEDNGSNIKFKEYKEENGLLLYSGSE